MTISAFRVPTEVIDMRPNEIHIWRAVLDQPQDIIQRLSTWLAVDEKKRADCFRFEQDCRRYIVGRGVLRGLLAHYLSSTPERVQLSYGPNGKPFLADVCNKENLCFNLSHSEGYALFAFTQDREIGVDIEYVHAFGEMEEIAKGFFSSDEHLALKTLSKAEKKTTFFNFWTRKEAFVKAVGMGLSHPFDQIDVSQCPGRPVLAMKNDRCSGKESLWSIHDLNAVPGFAAAFAVEGRNFSLQCWQWSDDLANFIIDSQPFKPMALN